MGTREITREAFREAQRLGQHWVGPEHGLLVILRGDGEDIARRALEEAGLDAGRFERLFLEELEDGEAKPEQPETKGVRPNPAWYACSGRAQGFASALGTGQVRPVDLLLALLWDNRQWNSVQRLDVSREAVVDALARFGVMLPLAQMPELEPPWANAQRVDFARSALDRVTAVLHERHPPGSGPRWGFNHDDDQRGWALAEEGIDLQGIVDAALAGESGPPAAG